MGGATTGTAGSGAAATNRGANIQSAATASSGYTETAVIAGVATTMLGLLGLGASMIRRTPRKH
ncbi:hypothetical protein DXT87_14025 [Arthrobacter sp. AET 35A]|nr:hypothetical protein [Arthrobacter sp. AET 35A]